MYKAIIIDDEEMARTLLFEMLKEYCTDIDVVDLCKDLPTGVKSIRKNKPDLVFLDIEMPGHSGLELLDFFDEDDINFSIIFVTAYSRYAVQAFKLSAVDYLLKPIEVEDLKNSIELFKKNKYRNKEEYAVLRENIKNPSTKKIALHTLSSINFVNTQDILFFQGDGSYTKVFLKDGRNITLSKGLKHFENLLAEIYTFFRCHKSYIVNLEYITDYIKSDGGYLVIDKMHEIMVSSEKIDTLLKLLSK
ncbi:MAG: LytTR family DNA-binding domain-containing protein [Raineya sp.]|jgi:two-component system LytT family response regulator|nr:LytTR family DNA-binding domain-containing protein [Raineya sp.]